MPGAWLRTREVALCGESLGGLCRADGLPGRCRVRCRRHRRGRGDARAAPGRVGRDVRFSRERPVFRRPVGGDARRRSPRVGHLRAGPRWRARGACHDGERSSLAHEGGARRGSARGSRANPSPAYRRRAVVAIHAPVHRSDRGARARRWSAVRRLRRRRSPVRRERRERVPVRPRDLHRRRRDQNACARALGGAGDSAHGA